MEAILIDKTGKDLGKKVKLNKAIFGIEPNEHAMYLDVKGTLAARRQGTHQAKERGEVVGSTRKIKRQKGTGTARAGSIKNPLFKGGGRVFGPKPRFYDIKLNKKVKSLARKSALSSKAADKRVAVIQDFTYDKPATKEFQALVDNINFEGKKTVLVMAEMDKNVVMSARNIPNARTISVNELNTYEIMNADRLILSESSVKAIEGILS
jgi:large subunit ribosomal protein L4